MGVLTLKNCQFCVYGCIAGSFFKALKKLIFKQERSRYNNVHQGQGSTWGIGGTEGKASLKPVTNLHLS